MCVLIAGSTVRRAAADDVATMPDGPRSARGTAAASTVDTGFNGAGARMPDIALGAVGRPRIGGGSRPQLAERPHDRGQVRLG